MAYVDIVFDGPPSDEGPRFVEVEGSDGKGMRWGQWVQRSDGTWALRVPAPPPQLISVVMPELTDAEVDEFVTRFREATATGDPGVFTLVDGGLTQGEQDVIAERAKGRRKYGDAHDDTEHLGALQEVAAFLAMKVDHGAEFWPEFRGYDEHAVAEWAAELRAKHDDRQRLVVAAALLIAEIDRLDRAADREFEARAPELIGRAPKTTPPEST